MIIEPGAMGQKADVMGKIKACGDNDHGEEEEDESICVANSLAYLIVSFRRSAEELWTAGGMGRVNEFKTY
jgi:hypothetical protein